MKKTLVIYVASISIFLLVILFMKNQSQVIGNKVTHNIRFVDTDLSKSVLGYDVMAETERADYYFSGELKQDKESFIHDMEKLLAYGEQHLALPRHNKKVDIYFDTSTEDSMNYSNLNRLVLSKETDNSIGEMVSFLSEFKLPAWLSVGIELYWREQTGMKFSKSKNEILNQWLTEVNEQQLPKFGDAWFIPGFVDHELKDSVNDIAFMFVSYLEKQKRLDEIVNLFLEESAMDKETLNQYWREFTQEDGAVLDFGYQYFYNYNDFYFEVHSEKATILFKKEEWDYEQVSSYPSYILKGITYAEEWLDYKLGSPLVFHIYPYLGPNNYILGGMVFYSDHRIELYDVFTRPPIAATHEAVHAINLKKATKYNLHPLEEGIANAVTYTFENKNNSYYYEMMRSELQEDFKNRNQDE